MNAIGLLANAQQGHARLMALWRDAKPWLIAGHRLVITIKPGVTQLGAERSAARLDRRDRRAEGMGRLQAGCRDVEAPARGLLAPSTRRVDRDPAGARWAWRRLRVPPHLDADQG
jgi:hypothetical protein